MTYFTDLELTAEASLFARLLGKDPLVQALLQWHPGARSQRSQYCKVIVEVKDDGHSRNDDPDYQTRLRLAAKVCRRIGIGFVTAMRSRDLDFVDFVQSFALDRHRAISPIDVDHCMRHLISLGGSVTVGELARFLGRGALGHAKAAALLIGRVVSVDISQGLRPDPDASVSIFHPGVSPDTRIAA